MNDSILEKLKNVLKQIQSTTNLNLFAVLKRGDVNVWDIVIGGKNLEGNSEKLNSFLKIIQKEFTKEEIVNFSRLILFNSENQYVKNLNQGFSVTGSFIKLENTQVNNVFIKEGYLFHSRRNGS